MRRLAALRSAAADPSEVERAALRPPAVPLSEWALLTAAAAACLTAIEMALLQRKFSFVTGGFLIVDHLDGIRQTSAFVAASLITDAAVAGVVAAGTLWLFSSLSLARAARRFGVLSLALLPFLFTDLITYQLLLYLGDAFDVSLAVDLSGGAASELLAVSYPRLLAPALLLAGALLAIGSTIWGVNRRSAAHARPMRARPHWRVYGASVAVFIVGVVTTYAARTSSAVLENGLRRKPASQLLGWIVDGATDRDHDGFGALDRPPDPDPQNPRVFPYALDVPGNGIDENGVGGDLPGSFPAYQPGPAAAPPWHRKPNVVLVLLESFRADAVGRVHNGHPVTPVIDALAARGASSPASYSHNGYSAASRQHLLSGSLTRARGGTSLLDDFKANGYEVAYFSGQDETWGDNDATFSLRRSDVFYDARVEPHRRYSAFTTPGSLAVPLEVLIDQIDAFLARRNPSRPLFLYVNFHDTHFPYRHATIRSLIDTRALAQGDIGPSRASDLQGTYFNTAANVDRAVGEVLARLRRHLGTDPAVIVTADHGESLYDDGFLGHGFSLNDVQTRIPLVVADLDLQIEEPFGQAGLRDVIREALVREDRAGGRPRVGAAAVGEVFQYLGVLERPKQIGFRTARTRIIYDFRSDRVFDGSQWRDRHALDREAAGRSLRLIHFWESLLLGAKRHPSERDRVGAAALRPIS